MNLTKNFTLEEFEDSGTAKSRGISNKIPDEYMQNVQNLADILQIIRNWWKAPIKISSGYRSDRVNSIVGGAKNSDHRFAAAADITTVEDTTSKNKQLFNLICYLAKEGKIKARQIIDEWGYNWIHISVNHNKNTHRDNQILHLS